MKDGGRHGAYVDPSLTRQRSSVLVNRQDHQAPTVGPCKTCSHPQREFLEVSAVFVWLCVGAAIVRCSSRFCSVISRFPPFI